MKIVLLEGSPNKNGSSNMLTEQFCKGAKEAEHSVQKDNVNEIRQVILDADMMMFVMPLYYLFTGGIYSGKEFEELIFLQRRKAYSGYRILSGNKNETEKCKSMSKVLLTSILQGGKVEVWEDFYEICVIERSQTGNDTGVRPIRFIWKNACRE